MKSSLLLCALLLLSSTAGTGCAGGMQRGTATDDRKPECVILLHGMGRTYLSLAKMERMLGTSGFITVNVDYPARKEPIEDLANKFLPAAVQECAEDETAKVHFVTHSLGGILVRYYLSRNRLERLGRVVMLSPPNQGSEAADFLKDQPWYRNLNGPAGQQLVTGPRGLPQQLGPVDYPVGIITGSRAAFFDSWLSKEIPGSDDGKVSVERAKVDGMTDFMVLPYTHPFIMNADEVIAQTIYFLRNGAFRRKVD